MENNYITTQVLKIGVMNVNGRIYTDEAAAKMISDFEERRNSTGAFYGQIGFPKNGEMDIMLKSVSHDVEKLWKDSNGVVWAKIKILNTPAGRNLKDMIEDNIHPVFRSRSAGVVESDGSVQIKKLFSFDAISSADDSFVGILKTGNIYSKDSMRDDEDYIDEPLIL